MECGGGDEYRSLPPRKQIARDVTLYKIDRYILVKVVIRNFRRATHLGLINLDLFKFLAGPFLPGEGMAQFDFEGGLLSMCSKDLYI